MPFKSPPVTFINHFSKSGATLLFSLFDDHPDVLLMPVYINLPLFWARNNFAPSENFLNVKTAIIDWEDLFEERERAQLQNVGQDGMFDVRITDVDKFMRIFSRLWEREQIDWSSLFFLLHRSYCEYIGRNWDNVNLIMCHPHGFDQINEMILGIPNAKGLHIIRDPRSANLSYKKTHLKNMEKSQSGNSLFPHLPDIFFPYQSLRSLVLAERWGVFKDNVRNKVIRFEDLHSNPDEVIRDIIDWLGIRWDDCLKESTFCGQPWGGNSVSGKPVYAFSKERGLEKKWVNELSRSEIRLYESWCYRYLLKFDYQITCKRSFILSLLALLNVYSVSMVQTVRRLFGFLANINAENKTKTSIRLVILEVRLVCAIAFYFLLSKTEKFRGS